MPLPLAAGVAVSLGSYLLLAWKRRRQRRSGSSPQGDTVPTRPDQSWDHLEPRFAAVLLDVLHELEREGWQPTMFEGYRSPQRQAELKAAGRSKVSWSFHEWQDHEGPAALAADIIDRRHGWANPAFFDRLAAIAEAHGLEAGHYWRWKDSAHVQAVPSSMLSAVQRGADPGPYLEALA